VEKKKRSYEKPIVVESHQTIDGETKLVLDLETPEGEWLNVMAGSTSDQKEEETTLAKFVWDFQHEYAQTEIKDNSEEANFGRLLEQQYEAMDEQQIIEVFMKDFPEKLREHSETAGRRTRAFTLPRAGQPPVIDQVHLNYPIESIREHISIPYRQIPGSGVLKLSRPVRKMDIDFFLRNQYNLPVDPDTYFFAQTPKNLNFFEEEFPNHEDQF